MSQPGRRLFEVLTDAKSPFLPQEARENNLWKGVKKSSKKGSKKKSKECPKKKETMTGPSGSKWNELHLNWLHILLEVAYDLKDIFSGDSQLSQSSKIATSLRENLKEDWSWICRSDHEESNSIYGCLKDLVRQREQDDAFNTHSNTQSSTKHLTPRSAKSNSVTPQQHPRGTQDSLGEFERTPTPLPRNKEGVDPQTHTPQLLSRKRQLEEIMSPQRERDGIKIPVRHTETTPPPHQNRGGSPTPRQQGIKTTGHQLQSPATPSRHVPLPDSPVTHRQQDSKTPSREIQSHLKPDRPKPLLDRQSSFTWQQPRKTPNREGKIQKTPGGQKTPPKFQSRTQFVSTILSQHQGSQSATYDEEDDSDEEQDGEEEEGEEHGDEDDSEEGEDSGGISEAALFDKSEEDVKATGRVFLSLVRDAINNTKKGVESTRLAEQNLVFETRDPRPHHIKIDKIHMSTHPDLVLEMVFGEKGQRKTIGVVLEFKKRNHSLNDGQLLAQEVSELLGAVLEKMAAFGHRRSYKSYLISWHGLKGYISRFRATREYLNRLQNDSRSLQDLDPPTVRRTKEYDLTVTEERIDFAIACARIAVEELQEYERNRTSGLLDRILA